MKNTQTPLTALSIEDLHEATQQAVKNYLDFANTSSRTGSNIPDAVFVFLDYNADDNIDYYTEVSALALQALADPAIATQFKEAMGEHYYKMFIELLPRITNPFAGPHTIIHHSLLQIASEFQPISVQ
jgi:hypothetical protein